MNTTKDEIITTTTEAPVSAATERAEEKPAVPAKKKNSKMLAALTALLALIGAGIAIFMLQRTPHVSTGNARVTTDLITVMAMTPGILERFTLYEGRAVHEGEILGWIQHGESFRSPVDGIVVNTNVTPGQYILPMTVLATIADTSNIHIQANIYETNIQNVRLGQPVTVTIDAFGSRRFNGYVSNISHINQVELIGMPVALFTGTFRRFTQNVPVRIHLTDDVNLVYVLGASARVRLPVTNEARHVETNNRAANSVLTQGIVESVQSMNVYGQLPHTVQRRYVDEGDRVTAGQILAVLETDDLDIQMAGAEAALRMGEVAVATAEHNYGIVRTLYNAHAVPLNDLRQAEFALQAALASRQQAQAMVDATRLALERSVITSPIDGTITAVIARAGSPGMGLLFVVEDTDNLRIMTSFRTYDLGRITEGMEAAIISDAAASGRYTGVISRINPAFQAGFPIAVVLAEVLVVQSDTSLRIGMTVRLSVCLD
ncbi:MAG: efflux RND transporter periplasmic adaptor subunit [Treponema sp.]|nr:efflux RND transporter periplasmic adaptor subunit [Treponema sp.]